MTHHAPTPHDTPTDPTLTTDTPTAAQPTTQARAPRPRLQGLDALRALAVIGMVYMHVTPTGWLSPLPFAQQPAALDWLEHTLSGRAMSLFVLMAGISVALMTGGSSPFEGERLATARRRLAVRAGMLFLISLVVDQLSGMSLSILVFYALWMLLFIPLLRLRPGTLLVAAAVAGVVLPVFCFVVLNYGRAWPISPLSGGAPSAHGLSLLLKPQDWPLMLKQLLVGGGFQTPYALPLLLTGLAIGRLELRRPAVRRALARYGALLLGGSYLLSRLALGPFGVERALAEMMAGSGPVQQPWGSVLTLPPHQLYAMSIPMAPFMLGVGLLLLAGLLALLERPVWQTLLMPLTAAGRLALTWYAAHLVFIERVAGDPPYAFTLFAGMTAFALVVSPLWLRLVPRGPLEQLTHQAGVLVAPGRGGAVKSKAGQRSAKP